VNKTIKPRRAWVCDDARIAEEPIEVVAERPLTIRLNDRELVTLLTDFTHPRELTLGFLRNEGLLDDIGRLRRLQIDEKTGEALVEAEVAEKLIDAVYGKRLVTSGCGKGSIFYHVLDSIKAGQVKVEGKLRLDLKRIYQYGADLSRASDVYRKTRGVHGAALLDAEKVLIFREDIGRHNALDKLAGWALENEVDTAACALYTTGRITSEVMIKAGRMGAPIILSRSAPTDLALQLGEQIGLTVVGYLRGRRCRVYLHPERIDFPEAT